MNLLKLIPTTMVTTIYLLFSVSAPGMHHKDMAAYKKELYNRIPGLTSKGVQKRLLRADHFMADNNIKGAIAILKQMAQKDRYRKFEKAKIFYKLAFAYAQNEEYPKVKKFLAKVIEVDALPARQTLESLFGLAQLQAMDNDLDHAYKTMKAWFALINGENANGHAFMSAILYQKNRKEESLQHILKAISLEQRPREGWLTLAVALFYEKKEYANAAKYLYRLVGMTVKKKKYWTNLAANLFELKMEIQGLAVLRLAIMLNLLDKESELKNVANLYLSQKLPYEASLLIQDGLDKNIIKSNNSKNFEWLASSLIQAKEFDKAMAPLKKAAQTAKTGKLHALRARLCLEQGKYQEALSAFDEALKKGVKKDKGKILVEKGITLIELKRLDSANKAFKDALAYKESADLAKRWQTYLEKM